MVCFSSSMFGSFDFDTAYEVPQTQRQRQARRRNENAIEKRPTNVSQTSEAETGSAKIRMTMQQIKQVNLIFNDQIETIEI